MWWWELLKQERLLLLLFLPPPPSQPPSPKLLLLKLDSPLRMPLLLRPGCAGCHWQLVQGPQADIRMHHLWQSGMLVQGMSGLKYCQEYTL